MFYCMGDLFSLAKIYAILFERGYFRGKNRLKTPETRCARIEEIFIAAYLTLFNNLVTTRTPHYREVHNACGLTILDWMTGCEKKKQ